MCIEIDHDPELSPCGIHLYTEPRESCALCTVDRLRVIPEGDARSSLAARERARARGVARAEAAPAWGKIHV